MKMNYCLAFITTTDLSNLLFKSLSQSSFFSQVTFKKKKGFKLMHNTIFTFYFQSSLSFIVFSRLVCSLSKFNQKFLLVIKSCNLKKS